MMYKVDGDWVSAGGPSVFGFFFFFFFFGIE